MNERIANTQLCGEPYPKGEGLTCIKPAGHEPGHVTCLGYHPDIDPETGEQRGEGEYEYAEWWEKGTHPGVAEFDPVEGVWT